VLVSGNLSETDDGNADSSHGNWSRLLRIYAAGYTTMANGTLAKRRRQSDVNQPDQPAKYKNQRRIERHRAQAKYHRDDPASLVLVFCSVLIRHLPKPAQHVPVVEYSLLEIAGAAECNGAGVPQELPLPPRRLYRNHRTGAVNGFTDRKGAVDEIESQCHETCDFGHEMPALRPSPDVQPLWQMTETHCIGADR
jgi:hypothetical protein